MGRSLQFRVYEHQLSALFRLGFPTAPHFLLNLAGARNSLAHSSIGTPSLALRLLVDIRFQVLFHSPPGVLFTFPSRYWFTIGQSGVFSLGGWSPHIQTGYHVSRPTHRAHSMCIFVYGAVTLYRAPFQTLPLTHTLIQALGCSPFARRYLGNRCFFLFLLLLRCFSSEGWPTFV